MEFYKNKDFKTALVNGKEVSVPEDWDVIKVKDFQNISFINGFAFKNKDMLSKGKTPIIKIGNIQNNEIILKEENKFTSISIDNKFKLRKNDLIIGLSGAQAGKSGVFKLDIDCYLNQRNLIVRSNSSYFNLSFDFKLKKDLIFNIRSMGIPNISSKDLENIEMTLPLEQEQENIATVLTKQDELIELKEEFIKKEEKKRTFLQQEILSGRLRINADGRFYENTNWKEEIVNGKTVKVPENWEIEKIGNRIKISKENISLEKSNKDYKYYATGDIEQNKLLNFEIVNKENIISRAKKIIPKNSVWFARMKDTRKELFFEFPENDIILSTGMIGLISDNTINMKLIYEIVKTNTFNKLKDSKCMGSTQKAINDKNALNLYFILPKNIEEQNSIATVLTKQDDLIENLKKDLDLEKQKAKFLRQKLLSGEIRTKEVNNG